MSILNHSLLLGAAAGGGGGTYQISRSLRFNAGDSANLSRTIGTAGSRTIWTWAAWVKRSGLGALNILFSAGADANNNTRISFDNTDSLQIANESAATTTVLRYTTAVYRDPSAWMHIVVAVDTTQATANNRVRLYVNGSEVTTFSTLNNPTQSSSLSANAVGTMYIGRNFQTTYLNAMLADVYFVDGLQLAASNFGEFDTNGIWNPKTATGITSYGTNGFRLTFSDNSNITSTTLGKDAAGSNNFTPNNFSVTAGSGNDSLVDSPTNYGTDTGVGGGVRGNYATLNPLNKGSQATLLNGNLEFSHVGNTVSCRVVSTIAMSSGKWYCEYTPTTTTQLDNVGIALAAESAGVNYLGGTAGSYSYYAVNGQKYTNGSSAAYGATYTNGDVIGIAFDADAGTLTFYKNGASQGAAFTGIAAGFYVFGQGNYTGATYTGVFNFGQRPFAYTAPSGYKALCSTNLPTPTILSGATAMDVKLYTGNGSTQTISGLGFSPDLVWVKSRSSTSSYHALYDQIRGVNQRLSTNDTGAENTTASSVTSFDSTGFSLGSYIGVNENSQTFAAWCWDAGSSTVTNTAGTIQSSVRANASAGFSVVTYTGNGTAGATVGHGLGVAPQMVIVKNRDSAQNWPVYHVGLTGANYYILLNTTGAQGNNVSCWNNTAPSSTFVTLGGTGAGGVNESTQKCVAYCFAPVSGYSAFGSYTGNGSADGPFVYTGFRPRWVLIKNTGGATHWSLYDTARSVANQIQDYLYPSASAAEGNDSTMAIDVLSNGFKVRGTASNTNTSSTAYIYAAFAENPFSISRAR